MDFLAYIHSHLVVGLVAVEPELEFLLEIVCSTIHATLEYTKEVLPKFSKNPSLSTKIREY